MCEWRQVHKQTLGHVYHKDIYIPRSTQEERPLKQDEQTAIVGSGWQYWVQEKYWADYLGQKKKEDVFTGHSTQWSVLQTIRSENVGNSR